MLQGLQKRWGLSPLNVVLSLCTFAIGGSLCGYVSRMILMWIDIPKGVSWWLLYLLILTITWPISVLLISIPFGQFAFFKSYLSRLASRIAFGKSTRSKDTNR
jgi:hypothetical protein